MDTIGGIAKGLFIAVILSAVMIVAGALGAGYLCDEQGCGAARGLAGALGWDGEPFKIGRTAMELIAGLLALGLAVTMMPERPARLLGLLFMALMAGDGFLMALSPPEDDEPVPMTQETPAEDLLADLDASALLLDEDEPAAPACPDGAFRDQADGPSGPCQPCLVARVEPQPAAASLIPLRTDAHWVYASDRRVATPNGDVRVSDLVQALASTKRLCEAPGLLMLGSASSDGERALNQRRARSRAGNLASAVSAVCGSEVETYALSLGQSQNARDVKEDRPVTILQVYPVGSASLSAEVILEELGYTLAEKGAPAPLLERRDRFPEPWVNGAGDQTVLDAIPRPQRTEMVLAPGAPMSCDQPAQQGLDADTLLRQ